MQSDEATVSHPGIGSIFGSRSWHGRGPRAMVDIALAHRHPCQWLAAVTISRWSTHRRWTARARGLFCAVRPARSWYAGPRISDEASRRYRAVPVCPESHVCGGCIVSVIIGQGLLLSNFRILEYGALVWLAFHLFVLAYEEPTLHASFGPEYEQFCAAVPRWVSRLHPWSGPQENA